MAGVSTPGDRPVLPADDHPHATAEGRLSTVTDDEYFDGLAAVDLAEATASDAGLVMPGTPIDGTEGVVDLRHDPAEADARRVAAGDQVPER